MKALKKARAEYQKAVAKRDKTKEQLEADEFAVKECESKVIEAENNEYVGMIRELGVSVEEFLLIKEELKRGSLASIVGAGKEKQENDESVKGE